LIAPLADAISNPPLGYPSILHLKEIPVFLELSMLVDSSNHLDLITNAKILGGNSF